MLIDEAYMRKVKFSDNYVSTGKVHPDALRKLEPTRYPTVGELYTAMDKSDIGNYTVMISGLPFNIDEESVMKSICTFNGFFPLRNRCISTITFRERVDGRGQEGFSGIVYITLNSSHLVKLLFCEFNGVFFCYNSYRRWQLKGNDIGLVKVQLANNRTDFRQHKDNLRWSTRVFERCWSFHPPLPGQSASGAYDRELERLSRAIAASSGPQFLGERSSSAQDRDRDVPVSSMFC
jgi:hypothetical protein